MGALVKEPKIMKLGNKTVNQKCDTTRNKTSDEYANPVIKGSDCYMSLPSGQESEAKQDAGEGGTWKD